MCKEDLALNNLQWLIGHKNPTQPTIYRSSYFKSISFLLFYFLKVALSFLSLVSNFLLRLRMCKNHIFFTWVLRWWSLMFIKYFGLKSFFHLCLISIRFLWWKKRCVSNLLVYFSPCLTKEIKNSDGQC